MPRIESGSNTTGQANVGANFALPVQLSPLVGGTYSAGFETTSLAFTSNVVVWDFRNPSANLMLITKLEASAVQMAIPGGITAQRTAIQMFVGRAYTALSNTGRTALTLTTNNCKLRTSFATSGAEIGFASVVGGITGGTVTEDVTSLATHTTTPHNSNAAAISTFAYGATADAFIWQPAPVLGQPIILAQNEGIRLRWLTTTVSAVIIAGRVNWAELGSTVYP